MQNKILDVFWTDKVLTNEKVRARTGQQSIKNTFSYLIWIHQRIGHHRKHYTGRFQVSRRGARSAKDKLPVVVQNDLQRMGLTWDSSLQRNRQEWRRSVARAVHSHGCGLTHGSRLKCSLPLIALYGFGVKASVYETK